MSDNTAQVIELALRLPANERATVIESLLSSLDQPDKRIDALWAKEAEVRIAAFEAGEMQSVPAEEVVADAGDQRNG